MKMFFAAVLLCYAIVSPLLWAQTYPSKSVRFIVPFPPGGANDVIARLLATNLTKETGKSFVVDNRGGANSIIGCDLTAKATPDGYTILIVPAGFAINPGLYKQLPFDSLRDFSPVSLVGNGAYVLVTNPQFPVQTAGDLIALAKAKPDEVRFASAGIGNATHLAAELFNMMAGTQMTHVPYKGGGAVLTDLFVGRISVYFSTVALAGPHIVSGRLKGIGVTTLKRVTALPQLPTISESGLPGYDVNGWYGILMPARAPAAIVRSLNDKIKRSLEAPELLEKLSALGIDAAASTSEDLEKLIKSDITKWKSLISRLNLAVE